VEPPALDDWLAGRFPGAHPVAAVVVTPDGTATAVRHAPPEAELEIGSISKGVTGLLYADARDRGEVGADTTLGELLPLAGAPAARVTLGSLATHHSGLPGLPSGMRPLRRTWALWTRGANPYGETLEELLELTRPVEVGRPRPAYSNLGFQLLGHAVAAAAGRRYAELVAERLADPLALGRFTVPASATELGPHAVTGTDRFGRPRQPWTGEALGPAGGIRATAAAMARLTGALLDGSAPGVAALDPVERLRGPVRIGAAWIVLERHGRTVTWHNGGTGGFRSWLGLDRAAGTGAALLSARSVSVDAAGFDLLARVTPG
jgi:CubicO group peptidase (beta-lactamase class C family)